MDEARAIEERVSENEPNDEGGNPDTPYTGLQPENTSQKFLRSKPAKNTRRIKIILALSCFLLALITIITTYSIRNYNAYNIIGTSMQPTLDPNDTVVIKPASKFIRNNIIIFNKPNYWNVGDKGKEVQVIKRIKGLPGDKLEYYNNNIMLNNKILYHFNSNSKCDYHKNYTHILKKNEFFVLGDNSKTSIDSRYIFCHENPDKSFVHRDMVLDTGRIVFSF